MIPIAAIAIFALIIFNSPKTYEIDRTLEATEIPMANQEEKTPAEVTIEGVYKTYWLRKDTFKGNIILKTQDVTLGKLQKITFAQDNGYGGLSYRNDSSLDFLGYIKMNKEADEIIICIFEDEPTGGKVWSLDKGTVITYPKKSVFEIRKQLYGNHIR